MEFIVNRDPLLRELGLLQEVAAKKSDRPVLACVRVEAKEDEILLDATDGDVSLGCILVEQDGLTAASTGIAVVDARRLYSYIKGMESKEVLLATDDLGWLEIRYPDRRDGKPLYRMPGHPAADFPAIPEPPESDSKEWKSASLPAPAFVSMASRAEYVIQSDKGTINIKGVLLQFDKDATRLIATDGTQLIVSALKGGTGEPWDLLLPRKALASVSAMCRSVQLGGSVEITRGPNHVFAFAGGRVISSTLLAAQFPPWQTIDKNIRLVKFAALDTKRFRACTAQAAAVLDDRGLGGVKLQFSAASNILKFNAQSSLFGEADQWMDMGYKLDEKIAETIADKDLTVRLGHSSLLDFLASAQSEVMKIAGSDGSGAVKLIDGDLETDGFQTDCIIMPINEAVAAQAAEVAAAEPVKAVKGTRGDKKAASAVAGAQEKPRRARGRK